jgi:hypothetical protein
MVSTLIRLRHPSGRASSFSPFPEKLKALVESYGESQAQDPDRCQGLCASTQISSRLIAAPARAKSPPQPLRSNRVDLHG